MGVEISIPSDLLALLEGVPEEVQGQVTSNLAYMPALDGFTKDGQPRTPHSRQAPEGVTGPNMPYVDTYFQHAVNDAVEAIGRGAPAAQKLTAAVTDATLFAMRQFALDTPVDTGRAKGSWDAILPNGTSATTGEVGPSPTPVTAKKSYWRTPEGRKEAARRRKEKQQRGGAS